MNLYLITCAVNHIPHDTVEESLTWVRFLDSENCANFNTFLSSLKDVKKFRILSVEWESEEVDFLDNNYECSNTIH